jgi:hypothetical protein
VQAWEPGHEADGVRVKTRALTREAPMPPRTLSLQHVAIAARNARRKQSHLTSATVGRVMGVTEGNKVPTTAPCSGFGELDDDGDCTGDVGSL